MRTALEPIQGELVRGSGSPNRTYARDRVCEHGDCTTLLSIYNRWSRCWLHEFGVGRRHGPADDAAA